jgi:hypothetical protein
MWTWVKHFFTDETAFIGIIRGLLLALGGLQVANQLPDGVPSWVGAIALLGGGMIRAGDKNTPAETAAAAANAVSNVKNP